jgi:hypothetical protein
VLGVDADPPTPVLAEQVRSVETSLRADIKAVGGVVLPFQRTSHMEVATRAVAKQPPFAVAGASAGELPRRETAEFAARGSGRTIRGCASDGCAAVLSSA